MTSNYLWGGEAIKDGINCSGNMRLPASSTDALLRKTEEAHEEFATLVDAAVRALILKGWPFSTDEVWLKLEATAITKASKAERNVVGATMRRFAEKGYIVRLEKSVVSQRPSAHHRRIALWKPQSWSR